MEPGQIVFAVALMARYGPRYADYAARVPRFIDLRSLRRARRALAARL